MSKRLALVAALAARIVDSGSTAVVLRGRRGSGTTHATNEVADRVRAHGIEVRTIAGGSSAHALPYVSLLPLLPAGAPIATSEADLVVALHARLTGPPRLLLVVDEISRLDSASAEVLRSALASGDIDVLATDTSADAATPGSSTWKRSGSGTFDTIDLPALDRVASLDLARAWAPDLPPAELRRAATLAAGNPAMLRALVTRPASIDEPAGDEELRRLVDTHHGELDDECRSLVTLLAVTGPLQRSLMRTIDDSAVDRLVALGLVGGDPIEIAHPLDAAMFRHRDTDPSLFTRLLATAAGSDAIDVRFVADWTLRGTGQLPVELARAGAHSASAHGEPVLARRLCEAIQDPDVADLVARSVAEARCGDLALAITSAHTATENADTDTARVDACLALANLLFLQADRQDEALFRLERLRDQLCDPTERDRVASAISLFRRVGGTPSDAGAETASTLDRSVDQTFGAVLAGRLDEARRGVDVALSQAQRWGPLRADAVARLELTGALGALQNGDIGDSQRVVDDRIAAIEHGFVHPGTAGWLAHSAETHRLAGDFDAAEHLARRAVAAATEVDDLGLRSFTVAELGCLLAESGRGDEGARLLREVADSSDVRTHARILRGEVRLAPTTDADSTAAHGAEELIECGVAVWAMWVAYEAVRCGRAPRSAAVLRRLDAAIDGPLITALADHASAAVDEDVAGIGRAADRLDELGYHLVALDAFADECSIRRHQGDDRGCRRRLARAHSVASSITSHHRLPAADRIRLLSAASESLTARQTTIARLAAGGSSSRSISNTLDISIRTVDNHLSAVYRKLDIAGRDELIGLLAADP